MTTNMTTILENQKERYPIEYQKMISKYCPFISKVGEHGGLLPAYCMGTDCMAFQGEITGYVVIMPHCLRLQSEET